MGVYQKLDDSDSDWLDVPRGTVPPPAAIKTDAATMSHFDNGIAAVDAAVDANLQTAMQYADGVGTDLRGEQNPLNQYALCKNGQLIFWVMGNVPGRGIVSQPTVAQGVAPGHIIVNYG